MIAQCALDKDKGEHTYVVAGPFAPPTLIFLKIIREVTSYCFLLFLSPILLFFWIFVAWVEGDTRFFLVLGGNQ